MEMVVGWKVSILLNDPQRGVHIKCKSSVIKGRWCIRHNSPYRQKQVCILASGYMVQSIMQYYRLGSLFNLQAYLKPQRGVYIKCKSILSSKGVGVLDITTPLIRSRAVSYNTQVSLCVVVCCRRNVCVWPPKSNHLLPLEVNSSHPTHNIINVGPIYGLEEETVTFQDILRFCKT